MIDVALAIDGEAVPVTLKTRTAGSYSDTGDWVSGVQTSSSIMATIQPGSVRDSGTMLKDAKEGVRAEAEWIVWSRSAIAIDDVITHASVTYRVIFVWPRAEGGFYRAALGRDMP